MPRIASASAPDRWKPTVLMSLSEEPGCIQASSSQLEDQLMVVVFNNIYISKLLGLEGASEVYIKWWPSEGRLMPAISYLLAGQSCQY